MELRDYNGECEECDREGLATVFVGHQMPPETYASALCADCLRLAIVLVESGPGPRDDRMVNSAESCPRCGCGAGAVRVTAVPFASGQRDPNRRHCFECGLRWYKELR